MITFNGIDLTPYLKVSDVRGRGLIQNELHTRIVPGRPGSYLFSKQTPERVLENDISIKAKSMEDLRETIDELNGILSVDEPVPIVYSDEPDVTYYGIPAVSDERHEVIDIHQSTLVFLCNDPYKYGKETEQVISIPEPEYSRDSIAYYDSGEVAEPNEPRFQMTRTRNLLSSNQAHFYDGNTRGFLTFPNNSEHVYMIVTGDESVTGEYSLMTTVDGRSNSGVYAITDIYGQTGQQYAFSCYIKGTGKWEVELFQGNQAELLDAKTIELDGDWQRVELSGVAPGGAYLRVYVRTKGKQKATCYIDGLQLERGDSATEWVPPFDRSGVMIEEGTTNLVENPLFIDDWNGWTSWGGNEPDIVQGGTVGERRIRSGMYGTEAVQITATGQSEGLYQVVETDIGKTYTASVYVKVLSGRAVLRAKQTSRDVEYGEVATSKVGEWERLSLTFLAQPDNPKTTFYIGSGEKGEPGTYIFDGVQVEEKPYMTSFTDDTREPETLTVPVGSFFDPVDPFTLEWYVQAGELSRYDHHLGLGAIFDAGGTGDRISFLLRRNVSPYRFVVWSSESLWAETDVTIPDNANVRVSIVHDGLGAFFLYIDGRIVGEVEITMPISLNTMYIGNGHPTNDKERLSQYIDEFRIHNVARTPEEIAAETIDAHTTAIYKFDGNLNYESEQTATADNVVNNRGKADAFPLFNIKIAKPTTFIDISKPGTHIRLGEPYDETEQKPMKKQEQVFYDELQSVSNWTSGTYVDDGEVTGRMDTDGDWFRAYDYGAGQRWHGPARKKNIGEPLEDFIIDVRTVLRHATNKNKYGVINDSPAKGSAGAKIKLPKMVKFENKYKSLGRAEAYLLDEAGDILAMIGVKDPTSEEDIVRPYARIGSRKFLLDKKRWKGDFYGMMRISRINNVWELYFAQVDSKGKAAKHSKVIKANPWRDVSGQYGRKVSMIQLHLGAHRKATPPKTLAFRWVRIYKVNRQTGAVVPYIAMPGDTIEINHYNNKITINGEEGRGLLGDLAGSDFFSLPPGETPLSVTPYGAASVECRFKKRWL